MVKNWREVKEEIEADIDRIMWDEPEEITKSMRGIYPSGAGAHGQTFGNMLFVCSDLEALGALWPCWFNSVMDDPEFTLNHWKKLFRYVNDYMAQLLGGVDTTTPNCPAPWLNLPKVLQFCQDIMESFDTIKTKEEFRDLIWSWNKYMYRLYTWSLLKFPWHLGLEFPRIEQKDIEELAKLAGIEIKK